MKYVVLSIAALFLVGFGYVYGRWNLDYYQTQSKIFKEQLMLTRNELSNPKYCFKVPSTIADDEEITLDQAIGSLTAARDAHWLSVNQPVNIVPYEKWGEPIPYPGDTRWVKWDLDWVIRYQAIINLLEKIDSDESKK